MVNGDHTRGLAVGQRDDADARAVELRQGIRQILEGVGDLAEVLDHYVEPAVPGIRPEGVELQPPDAIADGVDAAGAGETPSAMDGHSPKGYGLNVLILIVNQRLAALGLTGAGDTNVCYCPLHDYLPVEVIRERAEADPGSRPFPGCDEGELQIPADTSVHSRGVPGGPVGIGMKWNETGFLEVCKLLKRWWPGTELNRRRQPFQGCALPTELPGRIPLLYQTEGARVQPFISASAWPVASSTPAWRLLPWASMVTMVRKFFTRRCHIASGIPNSIKCTPTTFSIARA
jgi:hypothetical protein